MDPSVVVASEPPKPSRLPKLGRLIIPTFIIIALAVGGYYLLPQLLNRTKNLTSTSTTPDYSSKLNQSIKKAFSSSSKYEDILEVNNLAYSEANLDKKYKYYLATFSKVSKAYKDSKNPEVLLVAYQLQDYLKAFPQYKEGDAPLPK